MLTQLRVLAVLPLFLTGCLYGTQKQFFAHDLAANLPGLNSGNGGAPTTPTPSGPGGINTQLTNQQFAAATSQVKKIDFLFVVDNSGSMSDNQAALAAGFEQFANTFYRRADLDICTSIVTSDRFLGRTNGGYQRERLVDCTKPAGSSSWTSAQMDAHIDALIADFKVKVNVGTAGNGTEMLGKALISYVYDLDNWGQAINPSHVNSFFRSDAVANISFVTDENNWYVNNPNVAEAMNDLPAVINAQIPGAAVGVKDTRKGIKNYLDDFFTALRPSQGLSYSITSLLETGFDATPGQSNGPAIAQNLGDMVTSVGRESILGNVESNAAAFASVYNGISNGLVDRANAFNLSHSIYEPTFPTLQDLQVSIVSGGTASALSYGSDYTVAFPNGIVLNPAIAAITVPGDVVSVDYRFVLP